MGSEDYAAERGDWSDSDDKMTKGEKDIMKRVQRDFKNALLDWEEIREEASKDQRALSTTGCWTDEEIDERRGKRPCIHLDQLSQHISFLINNVRSSPLAIRVDPESEGAAKATAELRSKRIRAIEYECNAAQAYWTALESAASMGFGVFGVTIDYKSWDSMQRVIKVRRFPNAHAVIWDLNCEEIDWSDMKYAFVLHKMSKEDYELEYGKKALSNFGEELQRLGWMNDDSVQVAEYWYLEKKKRRMFHLERDGKVERLFADELMRGKWSVKDDVFTFGDGSKAAVLDDRKTIEPKVRRIITNGADILDEYDWPGKEIPIIPVTGRQRFVKKGNKVDMELDSHIRMARDAQKLFDYYATSEAESVGLSPKARIMGYKGQFTEDYWETIHKDPRGYVEVEPIIEPFADQILPLPQFLTYEPPVQALEIGKESTRRSIQAAMASYGVTRLDDTNVKSGVALDKIQQQNDLGSFHFIDNYKIAIRRAARIINDLLDDVEQPGNTVSLRNPDDTQESVTIGGKDASGRQIRLTDEGQYDVTLTTGPNYQSQRQEAAEFSDTFVANMNRFDVNNPIVRKLLALVIKLKNLGPIGDEIKEMLDPDPENPEQQLNQAMTELQKMNQLAEAMGQKIQQLEFEKAAGTEKNITQKEIAALKAEVQQLKIQADLMAKAEELSSKENIETLKANTEREMKQTDAAIASMTADRNSERKQNQ